MTTILNIHDNIFDHTTTVVNQKSQYAGNTGDAKLTVISKAAIAQLRSAETEAISIDAARASRKETKSRATVAMIGLFALGMTAIAAGTAGLLIMTSPVALFAMSAVVISGIGIAAMSQVASHMKRQAETDLKDLDIRSERTTGLVAEENFSKRLTGLTEKSKTLFNTTVEHYSLTELDQKLLFARMSIDEEENQNASQ